MNNKELQNTKGIIMNNKELQNTKEIIMNKTRMTLEQASHWNKMRLVRDKEIIHFRVEPHECEDDKCWRITLVHIDDETGATENYGDFYSFENTEMTLNILLDSFCCVHKYREM